MKKSPDKGVGPAHRSTVPDSIYSAFRGALNSQVCIRLDGLPMDLIWEKIADASGERIHSNSGGPENEISRQSMLLGLFGGRITSCVNN